MSEDIPTIAGRPIYYNRAGEPITQGEAYAGWEIDNRRVAEDKIGEAWVSTVHLQMDHSFGDGPPLIFETMIFGGPHDQWQDRYPTEAAALAGHDRVVAALRDGREP